MPPTENQPPTTDPTPSPPTIYFAYGSNLWLHQMSLRCPTATYLGTALLPQHTWIINSRGYANVVAMPATSTRTCTASEKSISSTSDADADADAAEYATKVYGLVYALTPTDEAHLDKNEGVPVAYTKTHLPCSFWPSPSTSSSSSHSHSHSPSPFPSASQPNPPHQNAQTVKMLIYMDTQRTVPGVPREEYVYRMNRGIDDALRMGVPRGYVEGVLRRFIRDDDGGESGVGEKARGQAGRFRDESGVFGGEEEEEEEE